MFSAVVLSIVSGVPVSASPEAMARTLASLVPAAVEGLIRDVTLAALTGADQARTIADHAGCSLAEAAAPEGVLAAGLAGVRNELVFILRAGYAPQAGFIEEIVDLFSLAESRSPRSAIMRAIPDSLTTRLFPVMNPVHGLIARRRDLPPKPASFEALRRSLAAPATMRCRLRPVV